MTLTRELTALGADPDRVLDELAAPVYLVGPDGVIRWQNRASIAQLGEIRGTHYERVVIPEYHELAQSRLERPARSDPGPREFSVVVLGANGRRLRLRGRSQPIWVGDRFVGVLGMVSSASEHERAVDRAALTARQLEVLRLLACGRATPEIARELNIAVHTARNHIRRLLQSLDAHSRIEAVARGRELGLL